MVMEQSTDELVIGELFPCIMVNDEIIGKVICINEKSVFQISMSVCPFIILDVIYCKRINKMGTKQPYPTIC